MLNQIQVFNGISFEGISKTSEENFEQLKADTVEKSLEETYCLETMIKKIVIATQNNQKICLFIGRTADEPLPLEENCTWVSGDKYLSKQPCSLEDRIHLLCDFTDELQLEKFHTLFDKIVIDQSTCKFLDGDFISRFVKLLKKNEDSQLIFERTPYIGGYPPQATECINRYSCVEIPCSFAMRDMDRDKEIFTEYQEQADQQTKDTDQHGFQNQRANGSRIIYPTLQGYIAAKIRKEKGEPTLQEQAYKNAREDTERHTATLFKDVKVYEKATFPYPTNYSTPGNNSFVVATGVKK